MFIKIPKPMAGALMTIIIGAVCACHSGRAARPVPDPTMSVQTSAPPSSYVGTVPIPRIDERVITPMETVGAAPD